MNFASSDVGSAVRTDPRVERFRKTVRLGFRPARGAGMLPRVQRRGDAWGLHRCNGEFRHAALVAFSMASVEESVKVTLSIDRLVTETTYDLSAL